MPRGDVNPLERERANAKIRVYELLKLAKQLKKPGDKELYRAWAQALMQEWSLGGRFDV